MNKYLLTSLFIVFLFVSASGITLNTNKITALKQETVLFSGDCEGGDLKLEGKFGNNKIFSETLTCSDTKQFAYEYQISNSDPSGSWKINVSQGDEKAEVTINVKMTEESGYLLITFISPSPVQHYRMEDLNITIKLTDSGEAVTDATVNIFDLYGNRKEMSHNGDGVYIYNYEVPFDAPLGKWGLIVTAEKYIGENKIGGEHNIVVDIDEAPIKFVVVNPKISNYDVDSEISIEVGLKYFNGKPVTSAKVMAKANGKEFELKKGANTYSAIFKPAAEQLGSVNIILSAEDSAENYGEEKINVVISADSLKMFLKNYLLYIVIIVIAVIAFFYFTKSKVKEITDVKELESERNRLNVQARKIQEDYFDKAIISKATFNKRIREIEARLREIDKKLVSE